MEPNVIAIMAAALITFVIGWVLTQPLEIRNQRWPCILLSIPLLALVVNIYSVPIAGNPGALAPGIGAILAMGALAFIWRGVSAHYSGEGVMKLITGNLNARTGITPDLRLTKMHRDEGRVSE